MRNSFPAKKKKNKSSKCEEEEEQKIDLLPVNKAVAMPILAGISRVRERPAIKEGTMVTRSMLFLSANFQASFSASVFEAG